MSNTWYQTNLFEQRSDLAIELVRIKAKTVEMGLTWSNRDSQAVSVMTADGMIEHKFDEPDSAILYLAKNGGAVQLWKGDIDLSIGVDPLGLAYRAFVRTGVVHDIPSFAEISTWISAAHLSSDAATTRTMAQVEASIIETVAPIYSYSVDEWTIEPLLPFWQVHDDVAHRRRPSILFWFQYLADEYFDTLPVDALAGVAHRTERMHGGHAIYLFDDPTSFEREQLLAMNDMWRTKAP